MLTFMFGVFWGRGNGSGDKSRSNETAPPEQPADDPPSLYRSRRFIKLLVVSLVLAGQYAAAKSYLNSVDRQEKKQAQDLAGVQNKQQILTAQPTARGPQGQADARVATEPGGKPRLSSKSWYVEELRGQCLKRDSGEAGLVASADPSSAPQEPGSRPADTDSTESPLAPEVGPRERVELPEGGKAESGQPRGHTFFDKPFSPRKKRSRARKKRSNQDRAALEKALEKLLAD